MIVRTDGIVIVRPSGALDAFTVHRFRSEAGPIHGRLPVAVDLSDVSFVDSAGLGAIIGLVRRVRERGGRVELCCTRGPLVHLLEVVGLSRIIKVRSSLEECAPLVEPPGGAGAATSHRPPGPDVTMGHRDSPVATCGLRSPPAA